MATPWFQATTFKVLGVGLLALLMLIPLAQVRELIFERSGLRSQAVAAIAERWGAQQSIGGPVLVIPKRQRSQTSTGWVTADSYMLLLPDALDISGALATDVRRYGIYDTPVYTASLRITGRFQREDFRPLAGADATLLLDQAELRVPISDVRGIRRLSALTFAGHELQFGPADQGVDGSGAVAVPVDLAATNDDELAFAFDLTIAGTQSLKLLPLARHTEASLRAPWPDPSFDGAFLPAERKVDAGGFQARWQVLDLNRRFGQYWTQGSQQTPNLDAAGFGVSLYQPVGVYQQNERAAKYSMLFIALTFVAFFLFEVLKRLRVHPVQYLLVGLTLATFYVVLLALSEQIGFGLAYLIAAAAVVAMIGGYAAAVLAACRAGMVLGGVLALVYALLYGLVISEEYSLLIGAVALLVVVAALMYLTRRVDWYLNPANAVAQ